MAHEDLRGQVGRKDAKLRALGETLAARDGLIEEQRQELRKLNGELKFLCRRYIAYLILKSWNLQQKKSHQEQLDANRARIQAQLKFLEGNEKQIAALEVYNRNMALDYSAQGEQLTQTVLKNQVLEQ